MRHLFPNVAKYKMIGTCIYLASFLGAYQDSEIMKKNPFASIDQTGVGQLMQIAIEKGPKTRPGIKLGLSYVSCSPYRSLSSEASAKDDARRPPRRCPGSRC